MVWFKEKWKAVVGVAAALIGGLLVLLRINSNARKQKEILKKANESHKAELDANKTAEKKKDAGLQKIHDESLKEVDRLHRTANKKDEDLRNEKEKFTQRQKESDTLARDLADEIGADFVEPDDN